MSRSTGQQLRTGVPWEQRPRSNCYSCGKQRRLTAALCSTCFKRTPEYNAASTARAANEAGRGRHALARHRRRYGITTAERDRMAEDQAWSCKGCLTPLAGFESRGMNAAVVDHCHVTGEVRGILCRRCNVDLGGYERVARWAPAYLEAHHG